VLGALHSAGRGGQFCAGTHSRVAPHGARTANAADGAVSAWGTRGATYDVSFGLGYRVASDLPFFLPSHNWSFPV
jgi:hypothetical protein